MQFINDHGVHVVMSDGATDLDSGSAKRITANLRHYTQRSRDASWMGGTLAEVEHVLSHGWPGGMREVEALIAEFKGTLPTPKSVRRKQAWGEDGDEPSWEREQAGHDDVWRTSKRQTRKGPVTVRLMASWGGNADRKPHELMWNGVVLAVLIDLLEGSGYRVGASVNNVVYAYMSRQYVLTHIEVKRPENPLDLASIVPVVAHPAVYRWHGIDASSTAPFDIGHGHGSTSSLQAVQSKELDVLKDGILLPHVYTKDDAQRVIADTLRTFLNR